MKNRSQQKVLASLPNTGLGNKMLVWARAYCFAYQNGLQLFCSGWWGIHFGAWWRNEKKKRIYWGYFKSDSFLNKLRLLFFTIAAKKNNEPECIEADSGRVLYCFEKMFTSNDFYQDIRPLRSEVKRALYEMLPLKQKQQLEKYTPPVIGLHIRRGDFKLGSTLTPLSFFIDCVTVIRNVAGINIPVEVFTDAAEDEVQDLLCLPEVKLTETKPDVLDIFLLSKSDICILSVSSTFSMWAGFLSDGIVIKHPQEWHPALRSQEFNSKVYEGKLYPQKEIPAALHAQLFELFVKNNSAK